MSLPRITLPPAADRLDTWFDARWEPMRRIRALDRLFYTASDVGDFGMVWLAIGAFQAAVGHAELTRHALRLAVALGLESVIVNAGIKSLFHRERPAWEAERPMHLRKPRTSSFPSGHSSSAVTAAILLTHANPNLAPLWWALAAVVAISRVHVRIHHITDVLGGLVVGAVLGTLAAMVPLR